MQQWQWMIYFVVVEAERSPDGWGSGPTPGS